MVNQNNSSSKQNLSTENHAQQEMLQSILSPQQSYPWAPADASDYFNEATAAGDELAFSEEEATLGWQALSVQLNTLWGESTTSVQIALAQRFARRLSQDMIDQITAKANQVVSTGRPLAEQLIACVRDTLTGWDEADLQVMARPLAHAMRGQEEILDATIDSVRNIEWAELSPMEQARISLAAARWAIDHVTEQN
ncbi:hypothetical protein [Leptothoe spongobia]|uniref:Uncharacterized protein n=1 Tax=Leptothoe spongobia TAU-MAC 1115 TaxID=1967444 RepID=A0A947DDY3_9CYAN|nr:hypothetical protein [Leptothoe spongobia]MBT9315095.1 hypothetical protein [Leptothoe spongobia TAU-MAC 1115]